MSKGPIRFIHLSDFHVGKDDWAQPRLFGKIIKYVGELKAQGFVPDLIFFTGDIANRGTKPEYVLFRKEFYEPLLAALGGEEWHGKVFGVPGNHDVVRPGLDVLNRAAAVSAGSRFFDPAKEGKTAREPLFPRFKQYKQLMPGNVNSDWVASLAGTFAESLELNGQQIGIVGINTAWLSMDDHDTGKLTPGIPLVESALDKINHCCLHIVLGHHPLHWLLEKEAQRMRALFGNHNVIYLHGHMHRPEGRREDGAGEDFLSFQAGAAFHARDDELWKNGLMLGEVDCEHGVLRVSPRYWNPDNYDWPVETGRFPEKFRVPGSDWWTWPLPGATLPLVVQAPEWQPPQGWEVFDATTMQALKRDITSYEAARFFDGAEPDWALAQSPALPPRAVVGTLTDRIVQYCGLERPQVTLLIGPSGEGKSMALRQAVVASLKRAPNLRVLWRRDDDSSSITPEQIMALPMGDAPWLVATDAADLVAMPLHRSVQHLKGAGRSDVRFLLAARDCDWRAGGASRLDWRPYADYLEQLLSGLTLEDAELITTSWANFGAAGLGAAAGEDGAALAKHLYDATLDDAVTGGSSLLGGMLAVRIGEDLRGHVKSLMLRLGATKIPGGGSLCTAFEYLALMHAEGLDFLSRPVLAQVLHCNPASLQQNVLFPLGRESGGGGGTLLLTRHRRIARAAMEVMREDYGEDIDERYVGLAIAAKVAKRKGYVAELARWEYELPEHFIALQPGLAISIAIALLENDPSNMRLAVNMARLYRESGNPGAGAELLSGFHAGESRGFWAEWGACAGRAGDEALDAQLVGWSLADQPGVSHPENESAKLSLASLGVAFRDLYNSHHDHAFILAQGAVGHLGLMLRLDTRTRTYFEGYLLAAREVGGTYTDLHSALKCFILGLTKAWNCVASAPRLPTDCRVLRK